MPEPTKFIEANALLALQADDEATAKSLVAGLHRGELYNLMTAANQLRNLCMAEIWRIEDAELQAQQGKEEASE